MNHFLKITPPYFEAVSSGVKTFEVRHNDRGFQAGDTVTLCEWDETRRKFPAPPEVCLTGREITRVIGYVTGFEQKPNWVVFSLLPIDEDRP